MSVRENSKNHFEKRRDQDVVRELLIKKQALLLEFRNYEENGKYASSTVDEIRPELAPSSTRVGIIPVIIVFVFLYFNIIAADRTFRKGNAKVCQDL